MRAQRHPVRARSRLSARPCSHTNQSRSVIKLSGQPNLVVLEAPGIELQVDAIVPNCNSNPPTRWNLGYSPSAAGTLRKASRLTSLARTRRPIRTSISMRLFAWTSIRVEDCQMAWRYYRADLTLSLAASGRELSVHLKGYVWHRPHRPPFRPHHAALVCDDRGARLPRSRSTSRSSSRHRSAPWGSGSRPTSRPVATASQKPAGRALSGDLAQWPTWPC
jgi:hypothetical protein